MKTRIENVTLLTCDVMNTVHRNGSLTFEDDRILAINEDIGADTVIDGQSGIPAPGNDQHACAFIHDSISFTTG